MKLFDLDSPIMRVLSRIADLLLLNLITLICCIPVVTIGASLTAMHYMALKLIRGEDTYVIKGFFKSFKQNFKQATILWLILLFVIVVLAGDFYIMNSIELASGTVMKVISVIITVVAIIVLLTATFLFPTLAKFDNTVLRTIKNAFIISVLQFPKAVLMIILNVIPVVMLFIIRIAPLSILFGLSVPAYASAGLYNKFFKKLEAQIEEANGGVKKEEEISEDTIFHDEPIEAAEQK